MREDIANLVHPVINYGLTLRQRLLDGESPDLDTEQSILKGMLLTELEARRWVDYGGESPAEMAERGDDSRRGGERFLGIRYALVCWLDEFFILNSPWESKWNENKLEVELYGTNDRAWKFWEQAELAETRPTSDALEAFFLCVMLGFRGELRDEWDRLQEWVGNMKSRIGKIRGQDWTHPLEYEPPTLVPPHFGRERLESMVMTTGMTLLILIPLVAFFLVQRMAP